MRPMETWADRLERKRSERGWSKRVLADRSGVDYQLVAKYCKGKVKQPRDDKMEMLADALKVHFLWLRDGIGPETNLIPVLGYTSGGDEWTPLDDHEKGDGIDDIDFTVNFPHPMALRVRGTSMTPVYRNGDHLICSRLEATNNPEQFLRHDCVVKTTEGVCYIKTVLPGTSKGVYRLRSYNPDYADIEDVALEWAAPVLWIKRS